MKVQQSTNSSVSVKSSVAVNSSVGTKGSVYREQALEDMIRTGRKKAVFVVRARQERTGILYTDARLLNSPEDVLRAFGRLFERAAVEQMLAVAITNRGEPVAVRLIAVGGVDSCMVSVAEIMKFVLLANCPRVLLIHNHPSGSLKPSKEDQAVTERVEKAAELIGLALTDHIIVGDRQNGYSIKYEKIIYIQTDQAEESERSDGNIRNGENSKDRQPEQLERQSVKATEKPVKHTVQSEKEGEYFYDFKQAYK